MSQLPKKQGQWNGAEPGNGWLEGGAGPEARPSSVGLAPAHGLPEGRSHARVVRGPRRAESRRAPAKGGGAASVKSGAPSGRGGDAGCRGAGGWADGEVTGLPLAPLPSSGRQVAGRPASGPRPRRQRDLRTVRTGGQGWGRGGRPRVPGSGARRGRVEDQASLAVSDPGRPSEPPPPPPSRLRCRAGRAPLPGGAVTGRGRGDSGAVAFLHREIRARLRSPRIS